MRSCNVMRAFSSDGQLVDGAQVVMVVFGQDGVGIKVCHMLIKVPLLHRG